jgi:L-amino acid N-acyltransferase YncA
LKALEFIAAQENDLNTILEIYNYYIENSTATFDHNGISLKEFKNRIFINHDKYKTFLVFQHKELAGFCFLTQFRKKPAYDKTAEIGLYLKQQFAGRGLGKGIVKYLESTAKANQIEVVVASVSGENVPSIKLFKKMGYKRCAHYKQIAEKFGRKMDIIDFQKNL